MPVLESDFEQCLELQQELLNADIRVQIEKAHGSLGKRIKRAHRLRPACKILVGERDQLSNNRRIEFRDQIVEVGAGEWLARLRQEFRDPSEL